MLVVRSKKDINNVEFSTQTENGVQTLFVYYPKINFNLPILSTLVKFKQYQKYHDIGLNELKKRFNFKPSLIHANVMYPVGVIAKKWFKRHQLKYVITEHWTGYLKYDGRYENSSTLKLAIPKIANNSAFMLPVSEDLKIALEQHKLGKKYEVIPNVVNTNIFNFTKQERKHFLVVADLLDVQKNISGIIKAFSVFKKSAPAAQLKIAGGGDDEMKIKNLVAQLEMESCVKFLGRINETELAKQYNTAIATILFSNYENLPCVIAESHSCGTPVIATKVGGIPEIINKQNGILIEPQAEEQLTHAIQLAATTSWEHNSIHTSAQQQFSMEAVGGLLNKIYNSVAD